MDWEVYDILECIEQAIVLHIRQVKQMREAVIGLGAQKVNLVDIKYFLCKFKTDLN